jgi:hypothetical protein
MKKIVLRKLFKISIHALIFDIGIFLYVQFFLYGAITHNASMLETFPVYIGFSLIFIMQALFPAYMGRVMVAYTPYFEMRFGPFLESMMKFFFGITIFFMFVMGIHLFKHYNFENSTSNVTILLFAAIFALFYGGLTGSYIYKRDSEGKKENDEAKSLKVIFFFLVVLNCYVVIIASSAGSIKVAWGVIYIIFSLPMFYFSFRFLKKILHKLNKKDFFIKNNQLIKDILFSIVLMTVLTFWLEMITISMLKKSRMDVTSALFILMLTGYLPLRLCIEFEPPLTPISALTGILSVGYFIYYI